MPITRKDVERLRQREKDGSFKLRISSKGKAPKLSRGTELRVIDSAGSVVTVVESSKSTE